MTNTAASAGKAAGNGSVASRIVGQITDMIINGKLKPGDQLPTEPELCAAFCVGRNSVREAIKILEAYGIVHIKRADGTFINDTYTANMLNPMLYGILLEKSMGQDIIELRKVLDIGILYNVIQNSPNEFYASIRSAFDSLNEAARMPETSVALLMDEDIRFHMSLADAAENQLIIDIYSYVDRITLPSRQKTLEHIIHSGKLPEFIQLHRDILTLITNKDLMGIETILTEHYKFWEQNYSSKEKL